MKTQFTKTPLRQTFLNGAVGTREAPPDPRQRELRWNGRPVRVTIPVPADVWARVAEQDPGTTPFQTPAWRGCVSRASGGQDASRLYETPDGRPLLLMMARRGAGRLV